MTTTHPSMLYLKKLAAQHERESGFEWNEHVCNTNDEDRVAAISAWNTNELLRRIHLSLERTRIGDTAPTTLP